MDLISVEVIVTYDHPLPLDGDDISQSIFDIDLELGADGTLSEAELLFAILAELTPEEREHLCKVSFCIRIGEDASIDTIAPWLWCKDSPLYGGKIWLQQHLHRRVPSA